MGGKIGSKGLPATLDLNHLLIAQLFIMVQPPIQGEPGGTLLRNLRGRSPPCKT